MFLSYFDRLCADVLKIIIKKICNIKVLSFEMKINVINKFAEIQLSNFGVEYLISL